MGWRHSIAVLTLAVLAAVPVSGTVCAVACDSANTKAPSHHGSGEECEETAAPSSGVHIDGVSEHDCGAHDATVRPLITTTVQRSDAAASATPLALAIVHVTIETPLNPDPTFEYLAPPGSAPLTTTPLVLRI